MEKEVTWSPCYVCSKANKHDRKEVECKLVWRTLHGYETISLRVLQDIPCAHACKMYT